MALSSAAEVLLAVVVMLEPSSSLALMMQELSPMVEVVEGALMPNSPLASPLATVAQMVVVTKKAAVLSSSSAFRTAAARLVLVVAVVTQSVPLVMVTIAVGSESGDPYLAIARPCLMVFLRHLFEYPTAPSELAI